MKYDISFIIPTLNSEKTLSFCLNSIFEQKYLTDFKFEILIIDGGSKDNTLNIVKKYDQIQIYENPLVSGESAKFLGIMKSKGNFVCLVDSDNQLDLDYVYKSLKSFELDQDINGVEPIKFVYDKKMTLIDQYCSLFGINDPLNLTVGNFDKFSYLFNTWTKIDHNIAYEDDDYLIIEAFDNQIPTLGANSTIIKQEDLLNYINSLNHKYFFDNDFLISLFNKKKISFKFCKVKTGVKHFYCDSINKFLLKQKRRIKDYFFFKELRITQTPNQHRKLILFAVKNLLIIPTILESIIVFYRSRNFASFMHIPLSLITLFVYSYITIKFILLGKNFILRKELR